MRILVIIFCLLLSVFSSSDAQTNFSEHIAPLIYKNCGSCHRSGEIGPMNLTNYEEVKNWSTMIKYVTSIKYMPPWQADPEYSRFQSENFLTDEEIEKIAQWVDNGTPEGDPSLAPPFPDYPSGSLLGTPDLVLEMSQSHTHLGNNRDSYMYFVLPTGLTEDKVVKAIEFRAGNNKIVHHALLFEDTDGIAAATDATTPEYGFEGFGGFDGGDDLGVLEQKQYPGYVPGQKPLRYPIGIGQTLAAGSDLVIQIHYAPGSVPESDKSSVNIFFAEEEEEIERYVEDYIMLPFNIPGGFFNFVMLPEQVREFHGTWTIPKPISLVGISPHMHLLGQDWTVYVEHQDGTTTNLINIPEWDFNWQGNYYFRKYIIAQPGDVVHALATYDNTSENPSNPSSPPKFVSWGENTDDEMYYLPILFVDYKQGDEDIIFESETTNTSELEDITDKNFLFPVSPNPAEGIVKTGFQLYSGTTLQISIVDVDGNQIKSIRSGEFYNAGRHDLQFDTSNFNSGTYFLTVRSKNFSLTEKFIKT